METPLLLEMFGRLALAALLGGVVGWERESHGRAAGLRTMILVCLGSCLIMLTSMDVYRLFRNLDVNSVVRLDPARIAYGVVTGIGFLGAGAIIRHEDKIRGLTTAACLWVVTAIGLATGCGFYYLAMGATVLAYLTLVLLKWVERFAAPDTYNHLTIISAGEGASLTAMREKLQPLGIKVLSYDFKRDLAKGETTVVLNVRHRVVDVAEKGVGTMSALPGVRSVAWH